MMWVRFPNGQCIQYNTATYVICSVNGYTDLYTKQNGQWIAQVPNTCLIEATAACRVWNALSPPDPLTDELKRIKRKLDRALKKPR